MALLTKITNFLAWARITDPHDGRLSLTSIGLMVVLMKLAFVKQAGIADLGALFLSLASFNVKKLFSAKAAHTQVIAEKLDAATQAATRIQAVSEDVKGLETRLNAVLNSASIMRAKLPGSR